MDLPSSLIFFFDGYGSKPAVAVAGDQAEGNFGVVFRHRFGIIHHIAQVDDLLRLVAVDSGVHAGQGAVGIRED